MATQIQGDTFIADVNADRELFIAPTKTSADAGGVFLIGRSDAGEGTGSTLAIDIETNSDFQIRQATANQIFDDQFLGSALNLNKWTQSTATMTVVVANGFVTLNNGASTTAAQAAAMQSYRSFAMLADKTTYIKIVAITTNGLAANKVIEFGVGLQATTVAPTDGVFFRYDAAGNFRAVMNTGGVEVSTDIPPSLVPASLTRAYYLIEYNENLVRFWINNVLAATINSDPAQDAPTRSNALNVFARISNTGTPSIAAKISIGSVSINAENPAMNLDPATQRSLTGANAVQGETAATTPGQQANYANNAAPASATLSNTAAGYTTLGGQFQFAAVAGAETDYALFGFQCPTAVAQGYGRCLVITGVNISTFNTVVAVATTATVMQWSIGVGATAVSLATADAVAAKGPRRFPLGIQTFPAGAAVGAQPTNGDIVRTFNAPLVANAGEFVHIILKMPIATATATEIFRGVVSINGYWI